MTGSGVSYLLLPVYFLLVDFELLGWDSYWRTGDVSLTETLAVRIGAGGNRGLVVGHGCRVSRTIKLASKKTANGPETRSKVVGRGARSEGC